jgi:hypothetical protein
LKQRVALRCEIAPFELPDTAAYIATRIKAAGGVASRLFTREAVTVIHEHSRGIPRTISVICDNALVGGFARGQQPVDRAVVMEVCRDFRLSPGVPAGTPLDPEDGAGRPAADETMHENVFESATEEAPPEPQDQAPPVRRFTLFGSRR